jgi:acetyltransferase-like isoleucine patch superfamily enzyme
MGLVNFRDRSRNLLTRIHTIYLNRVWGHHIHATARISISAFLDKTRPKDIHIGQYTIVARGVTILSHDFASGRRGTTRIGSHCLIGVNAIVLPGISVGNHVVIGAGSVVTNDIPPNNLVAGNPARIVKRIRTGLYGQVLMQEKE